MDAARRFFCSLSLYFGSGFEWMLQIRNHSNSILRAQEIEREQMGLNKAHRYREMNKHLMHNRPKKKCTHREAKIKCQKSIAQFVPKQNRKYGTQVATN